MTSRAKEADHRHRATVLRSRCWSCDEVVEKRVTRRNRHHPQFAWSCTRCDVEWSGPGREGGAADH